MNFTNQNGNSQASSGRSTPVNVATTPNTTLKADKDKFRGPKWLRGGLFVMLASITVVLVGAVYLLHFASPDSRKYVVHNKMQAVFLQNGQVYFGHISRLNSRFIDLQNIYYLNNASTTNAQPANGTTSLSLVKLGCEIHGPYDEMIINQDQITFWENLRDDGQVAKAVKQYQQNSKNGQDCSKSAASSNGQSSATDTQAQSNSAAQKKQ